MKGNPSRSIGEPARLIEAGTGARRDRRDVLQCEPSHVRTPLREPSSHRLFFRQYLAADSRDLGFAQFFRGNDERTITPDLEVLRRVIGEHVFHQLIAKHRQPVVPDDSARWSDNRLARFPAVGGPVGRGHGFFLGAFWLIRITAFFLIFVSLIESAQCVAFFESWAATSATY